jgi:hypothetical protein
VSRQDPATFRPVQVRIGGLSALIATVAAAPATPVDIQVNGTVYSLVGAATAVHGGKVCLILDGQPYPGASDKPEEQP